MRDPGRVVDPADEPMVAPCPLLVTEQVRPGGKRSHVDALLAGFGAIGHAATLLDWRHVPLPRRAWIAGGARMLGGLDRGWGQRWLVPELERAFAGLIRARLDADPRLAIVHAHEPATLLAARRAGVRAPLVLTVHGPAHREVASAYGLASDHATFRSLREQEARAFQEADAVISVDHAHEDYVRELGRAGPVWVIPNFVDTTVFHAAVPAGRFPPGVESWIASRPLLLCARRLVPKNGVRHAVEAVGVLAARGTNAALLVVGDGPERAELESLTDRLGLRAFVSFTGSVPSDVMPGWLRRAAAAIVPSVPSGEVREATSISVLEAQACARPVVASALGDILEIVEDDRTGLLCPPGDAEAIANAVDRLLQDPALSRRLGDDASAGVIERHSHTAGARQCLEVYRSLDSR